MLFLKDRRIKTKTLKGAKKKDTGDKDIEIPRVDYRALFARKAAIGYRYLQFREPRLRLDAKINEPITEVGTRLVPSCV